MERQWADLQRFTKQIDRLREVYSAFPGLPRDHVLRVYIEAWTARVEDDIDHAMDMATAALLTRELAQRKAADARNASAA